MADVPGFAPQTQVAQLEATIRSAHALLQVGLVEHSIIPHTVFSNKDKPNVGRDLTNIYTNF